jgi:hypothetical protein
MAESVDITVSIPYFTQPHLVHIVVLCDYHDITSLFTFFDFIFQNNLLNLFVTSVKAKTTLGNMKLLATISTVCHACPNT